MFVYFGARDAAITAGGHVLTQRAASVAVRIVFGKAKVRQFLLQPDYFHADLNVGSISYSMQRTLHFIIIHAFHKRPSAVKRRYYRTDRRHLCSVTNAGNDV